MSSNNIDWDKLEDYLNGNQNLPLNEDEYEIVRMMSELKANDALMGAVATTDPKAAWAQFRNERIQGRVNKMGSWKKWAIAAVSTGIIITAAVFFVADRNKPLRSTARIVPPAIEKVTLVLQDNRRIVLDTASGAIQDGVVRVSFNKESAVFDAGADAASTTGYNTVLVPRGKKFQLTLEDGTRVWLNADSRFRFPVTFSGAKRAVELEGEGYFEVAHSATKPFEVNYHEKTVRVLGTRFNINAYQSTEAVTLLQGSIEWSGLDHSIVMKPGQQVQVAPGNKVVTRNVRPENYILWIHNTLLLEQKSVRDLFDDVARHYDVDVIYKGKISDSIKFNGAFEFPHTLDQMLSLLNSTGKVMVGKVDNYVLVEPKDR